MRFHILIALVGLVAVAAGTPLLDKKHSSLKVIDIPADLFADASETEDVKAPVEAEAPAPESVAADAAPVEEIPEVKEKVEVPEPPKEEVTSVASGEDEDKKVEGDAVKVKVTSAVASEDKSESGETEDGERPSIFGFRLPTIVVLRRPAVFDEPFPFFPFLNFNRRPAPSFEEPAPVRRVENRDRVVPFNAAAAPSESRPVNVNGNNGVGDLMFNMRQQMDSIFSSLFAPNPGYFPNRQFFPRPFFPAIPESSAEEGVDFDKLPNNYKNSTSETKIIDGRVVQVNKTVHKISGNNSNGFFQFSVIKIRPENPEAEVKPEEVEAVPPAAIATPEIEKAAESSGEVTTVKAEQEAEMNNPSLNEVDQEEPKETVMINTKYETDPGLLEEPRVPVPLPLTQEVVYDFVPLKALPLIDATKGSNGKRSKPLDLSSDLRVNNLMANEEIGRLRSLVDPDEIEVIEV